MQVIFGILVILTISSISYAQKQLPMRNAVNNIVNFNQQYQQQQQELRRTIGGTNYLLSYEKLNWFRAFQTCKLKNMELITIHNQAQYENVMKLISESKYPTADYWTSGIDLGNEGNFFWASNGKFFDQVNWHPNQPDNYLNNENCALLRNYDNSYKLNDSACDTTFIYFICAN